MSKTTLTDGSPALVDWLKRLERRMIFVASLGVVFLFAPLVLDHAASPVLFHLALQAVSMILGVSIGIGWARRITTRSTS